MGAVITLNAIAMFFVSNLNLGIFLCLFLGLLLFALAVLSRAFFKFIPKWIKITFIALVCIAVLFGTFLVVYGSIDTVDYKEDAIIVLGAGVRGSEPSLTLKNRLNAAIEYHEKNPDAYIVVSGGQGPQEDIAEAIAMEKYLLENGVDKDKIIKETLSESTKTNFQYSKEILNKKLGDNYTVAFITNEYHILRASFYAKETGFEGITHKHSNTNLSYLLIGVTRECVAVLAYFILGN